MKLNTYVENINAAVISESGWLPPFGNRYADLYQKGYSVRSSSLLIIALPTQHTLAGQMKRDQAPQMQILPYSTLGLNARRPWNALTGTFKPTSPNSWTAAPPVLVLSSSACQAPFMPPTCPYRPALSRLSILYPSRSRLHGRQSAWPRHWVPCQFHLQLPPKLI